MPKYMNLFINKHLLPRTVLLTEWIQKTKPELENAPDAKLRISVSNNNPRYYAHPGRNGKQEEYLLRKDREYAAHLAQSSYYKEVVNKSEKELTLLKKLLALYEKCEYADILYEKLHPARQKLINPVVLSDEEYTNQWLAKQYKGKPVTNSPAVLYTAKGEAVRSKSEVLIANMLYEKEIPYRYEFPLYLEAANTVVHPDFTILDLRHRRNIFWEHMGLLDDKDYRRYALHKINNYYENGIMPGIHLILTHETIEEPLNMKLIEKIIDFYFN